MRMPARSAVLLVLSGLVALVAVPGTRAADDPRLAGSRRPRVAVSRTNTELLVQSARAVATRLAAEVPLAAGSRVALQPEGHDPIDTDVSEALLLALNQRGFECVLLVAEPADSGNVAAAESVATAAQAIFPGPGAKEAYQRLQEERRMQQERADSLAALAASRPVGAPGRPVRPHLPLLTYRVAEGRVDYVRLFRSGIFGGERIERRATTRVTLKLHGAGDDAVRWSTSADTTFGDVVSRAELASLEDRMRPETRPLAPQSNLKKVVEPALVVTLIAGLVALFYQNRP